MLSHETILRQRYSLSFFATTFIIASTTQSSLAFSITQIGQGNNIGYLDTNEEYIFDESKKGTTTLNPTTPISISRGGTEEFLHTLRKAFPTWNFTGAAKDLAGSFEVKKYDAVGSYDVVGARFELLYQPGNNDPTPQDSTLHWIQRVVDNHDVISDEHGKNEDVIDVKPSNTNNPYYPWNATVLGFKQFYDESKRPDGDQNHNWLAELYLVKETEPQQVTIYNGVQWGWKNEVVPEPLTIFGSGMGLGLGIFFKKYSRKQEKAKNLEKLKS